VQSLDDQQLLVIQGMGEVAFIANELAHEAYGQLGNRMPIIDVAWGQTKGQELTLIIHDQVQQTAIKPADRGFATSGLPGKEPVLLNTRVTADSQLGGVNEVDDRTTPQLRVQIGHHRHQHGGHQLDKARIAHQARKLAAQMTVDVLGVVGFEGSVMDLLKQDDKRHDLAGMDLVRHQLRCLPPAILLSYPWCHRCIDRKSVV
jgi:hypothetical protein